MALTRWDPMKEMIGLRERMNSLFEDSLLRSRGTEEELSVGNWAPAVDIYEQPEQIILRADLPGMSSDQIQLKVENNMLTISGERRFEKDVKRESYHRVERQYGTFMRSFSLPSGIDSENIRAEHRDGVLEIFLPKREGSKPKAIKIDVR
ncbi:MAG: Hsp20/alpha crystallin family protein [Acidobacteriota bacterium]